jgi:hypothetical protein
MKCRSGLLEQVALLRANLPFLIAFCELSFVLLTLCESIRDLSPIGAGRRSHTSNLRRDAKFGIAVN